MNSPNTIVRLILASSDLGLEAITKWETKDAPVCEDVGIGLRRISRIHVFCNLYNMRES